MSDSVEGAGPVTIEPVSSAEDWIKQILGYVVAVAIISLILFIIIYMSSGPGDIVATIFLAAWLFFGLAAGALLLALRGARRGPKLTVRASAPSVAGGGRIGLGWWFEGDTKRIRGVTVRLMGREEFSRSTGGGRSSGWKSVFFTYDLPCGDASSGWSGKAALAFPTDAMPTFHAPNNNVGWFLIVTAHNRLWPDVESEYEITVAPPEGGAA